MKERPIIFSAESVRSILAGTKTQTRRIAPVKDLTIAPIGPGVISWAVKFAKPVKGVLSSYSGGRFDHAQAKQIIAAQFCPHGQPGDRLWAREAWGDMALPGYPAVYAYRADPERGEGWGLPPGFRWRSPIFMPRAASRVTLEITGVRVERLQDISEADAVAEGVRISSRARRSDTCYGIYECLMPDGKTHFNDSAYDLYRTLWERINGKGSWDASPWVWCIEFRRVEASA
jgi:hypothetical protein